MASINDLTLARKLTAKVAEACNGLEVGVAAILNQVSPTTAELLKWWFQEDFRDTREFNFHEGQRAGLLNVIYAHEVLGITTLKGLYQEIAPEVIIASDHAAQIIDGGALRGWRILLADRAGRAAREARDDAGRGCEGLVWVTTRRRQR